MRRDPIGVDRQRVANGPGSLAAVEASKRSGIAPFHVMEVMKAAAERQRLTGDVLHLEVGQPSTPAPSGALAAAVAAIGEDRLGYTDAWGTAALRSRIARLSAERYGVEPPTDRVVVTVGASGGFVLAMLAAFDVGDRVAITEPGYAAYRNIMEALGVEPVGIRLGPDFRPTVADLEARLPLKGLVLASPSNPTGTMVPPERMAQLARFCDGRGIRLVSDEIYHGITYGMRASSALEWSDSAIVLQSFSKYQSMTGWRVGWMVVPDELVRPVERLAQNLFISPPAPSQAAALAAFDCHAELDANVARYRANRDVLLEGLATAGFTTLAPPDGAFYLWVDITTVAVDSQDLCRRWLDELGVACTPGIDFDPDQGHRFIRMSYSESTANVTEAIRRIIGWKRRTDG
jgi:aspartate/methionine/tyrosine aminotransferase